jgi:hypothetical protein
LGKAARGSQSCVGCLSTTMRFAHCAVDVRRLRYSSVDYNALLTNPSPGAHIVYPYTDEKRVVETVRIYAGAGFAAGDAVILIAISNHLAAIERALRTDGFNIDILRSNGQLLCADAEELMSKFFVEQTPNPELFKSAVAPLIERAKNGPHGRPRKVRAFGEMVSILWSNDNLRAALQLEELWNEIIAIHSITLLCTYSFEGRECPHAIHACHSHTIDAAA